LKAYSAKSALRFLDALNKDSNAGEVYKLIHCSLTQKFIKMDMVPSTESDFDTGKDGKRFYGFN
jgi:hypothetical protein